ncbi:MAG TPA: single-stranded DNA-binding protein [Candidatus Hydrogenedentes bacterium]|nr:single-stranded DNA-binding protein [Candidatus Hydrogenedentota bacterium]HIJ73301.1 single-stranded DNA-binding protein [Candidatus Hydrogenedentota bacterium]
MSDLRMPDINTVILAGRLTRDPELRYLPSGTPVCKMGLASTRYFRSQDGERREETLFINVTVWSKTAEFCGENLRKGRAIVVEGRLKSDEWEDKTSGQKRKSIEIHGQRIQSLEWEDRGTPSPKPEPRAIEEPVPEDDIPF